MSGPKMAAELHRDMSSAMNALFISAEWRDASTTLEQREAMVAGLIKACANNTACGWADLVIDPATVSETV